MPKATTESLPSRRLTFNAHGTEAISSLKRALNLALFITPTAGIHFRGHGGKHVYISAAIQRSLKKLYNDLRRQQPLLPRKHFENFLEIEQGEISDEVAEKLNRDQYTFEQFLEVWYLAFGVGAEKPAQVKSKDLTKPISSYFINSSHNTYLPGNQLSGKATTETYKSALRQGCRCVEIDVWNNDCESPPTKSQAGSVRGGPRIEHTRHISSNSLHTAAANLKGAVDDKIERTRQFLGVEKTHSHSPRCSKHEFQPVVSAQDDGNSLNIPGAERSDSDRSNTSLRPKPTLPRDEPIVMHGWTFNQPIGFRQVCKAIREVGFETTHLPIIISLEVHADQEQQEKMVQIMREEWQGLLVEEPDVAIPDGQMPRLEQLLDKILVKVKRGALGTDSSTLTPMLSVRDTDEDMLSGSEDDRSISAPNKPVHRVPKVPICEKLGKLAVYTHSEHFEKFDSPAAKSPSHIFSISERGILDLWGTEREALFDHNRNFFMRAYPNPSRWDSSNMDPSWYWRKGVQMVAMNWQNWDTGMMLNKAMFSGEDGWVLKPRGYRSDDDDSTRDTRVISCLPTFDLIITVLAGQDLPLYEGAEHHKRKSLRPRVKCELHFEKAEERQAAGSRLGGIKLHTEVIKRDTGIGKTDHPEFPSDSNELSFQGVNRVVEPLSFVRFRVEHEPYRAMKYPTSWACIRLDRLATGYRTVPLMDLKGNETKGFLLVKVMKNYRQPTKRMKTDSIPARGQ